MMKSISSNSQINFWELFLFLLFVFIAILWGGSAVAAKMVMDAVTPMQGAASRLCIALVFVHFIYVISGKTVRLSREKLPMVWATGALMQGIPYILFFWGLQYVSAGVGGMIEGTTAVFVFLVARIFAVNTEPVTKKVVIGLLLGSLGVGMIFLDKLDLQTNANAILGILLLLAGIICEAISTVMSRKLFTGKRRLNIYAVFYHQILASVVFIVPVTLAFDGIPSFGAAGFTPNICIGLLFLGIFPTAIASFGYNFLIREWGPERAGAVGYLIPVAAVVIDFLFYRNIPTLFEIIGGITILLSLSMLSPNRKRKTLKAPRPSVMNMTQPLKPRFRYIQPVSLS